MASNSSLSSALQSIISDLGSDASLMAHLPFAKVTFADQKVNKAYPNAMLSGKLTRKAPRVWIYWSIQSRKLKFHSYYSNNQADRWLELDEVLALTAPNEAFRFATTPIRLCALAMYYFLRAGIGGGKPLNFLLSFLAALKAVSNELSKAKEEE